MNFSIVIPMYNKQHSIRRAVYSVLDQFSDLVDEMQLVIIDDGSTDNSLAIAKRIKIDNPHRDLVVHSQKNAGVSSARNKGIELARHNLLAFLDADDSYESHFLNEIAQLVHKYPSAGAYCTAYRFINIDQGTKRNAKLSGLSVVGAQQLLNDYFYSAATGDLPITSSSVCIRTSALQKVGGFPVGESMGEDQAVWSQLALTQKIAVSKKISANYFEGTDNSLMQTIAPSSEMPFNQRLQEQLNDGIVAMQNIDSVKIYIAGHLLDLIRRNIETGDLEAARKLINDPRSRVQFKRWVFWSMKLWVKTIRKSPNRLAYLQRH